MAKYENYVKLHVWIIEQGLSKGDAAKVFGVDRSTLSLWINNVRPPHVSLREMVQEKTGGKVKAADW